MQLMVTDQDIISISAYYNNLVCEFTGRKWYNSLSQKNPRSHKNWKFFVHLLDVCRTNQWKVELYLEFQFRYAHSHWKAGHYPLPSMLCSKNMINHFSYWLHEQGKEFNKRDKESNRAKLSISEKIMDEVMESAEKVNQHMKQYFFNRGFYQFQLVNEKMKYIVNNYWLFSAYYLYSFSFIRSNIKLLLHQTTDYKYGYTFEIKKMIKQIFPKLSSNSKMRKIAIQSRLEYEQLDSYFVPGEFNIFDPKATELFYRKSLTKLGYTDKQINNFIQAGYEQINAEKSSHHVSAINVMTRKQLMELQEEEELEEKE